MTPQDAARFALSVPRTPGRDPKGPAFDNIVAAIMSAVDDEIEARVAQGALVRR